MYSVKILSETVQNAYGAFKKGDTLRGRLEDLRPLVDCGMAEWIDGPDPKPVAVEG